MCLPSFNRGADIYSKNIGSRIKVGTNRKTPIHRLRGGFTNITMWIPIPSNKSTCTGISHRRPSPLCRDNWWNNDALQINKNTTCTGNHLFGFLFSCFFLKTHNPHLWLGGFNSSKPTPISTSTKHIWTPLSIGTIWFGVVFYSPQVKSLNLLFGGLHLNHLYWNDRVSLCWDNQPPLSTKYDI